MRSLWILIIGICLCVGCDEPKKQIAENMKADADAAQARLAAAKESADEKQTEPKGQTEPEKQADSDKPSDGEQLDAHVVLENAIAKAKSADKALLVHFSADWWGWCHKLEEFLDTNKAHFADDFHFVKIATDKMAGGDVVFKNLKKERSGGMPWMTILDGNGAEIITSVGPKGNVGCPVEPFEIEHFVDMIKASSDATEEELTAIKKAMTAYAKTLKSR